MTLRVNDTFMDYPISHDMRSRDDPFWTPFWTPFSPFLGPLLRLFGPYLGLIWVIYGSINGPIYGPLLAITHVLRSVYAWYYMGSGVYP